MERQVLHHSFLLVRLHKGAHTRLSAARIPLVRHRQTGDTGTSGGILQTKITSNVLVTKESSENLSLFISRVIEIINTTSELFIIDSAHILPEDIIKYLNADKWDIYYLGYPNTTKEDKLKEIRKYETEEDWTYKKSNAELLSIFDELISLSKKEKVSCEKLGIKYIDVSENLIEMLNIN